MVAYSFYNAYFSYFQVPQSVLDGDLVKKILAEYKIHNADVIVKDDCTLYDIIDVVEGNRVYIPCIYLLNKIDQVRITLYCCSNNILGVDMVLQNWVIIHCG